MGAIIALSVVGFIVYMMFFSCTFNNHDYIISEHDADGFHKLKCEKCSYERQYDPYEGIGG